MHFDLNGDGQITQDELMQVSDEIQRVVRLYQTRVQILMFCPMSSRVFCISYFVISPVIYNHIANRILTMICVRRPTI